MTTFADSLAEAIADGARFRITAAGEIDNYRRNNDGWHFETYGASDTDANRIAPADLVAVTFLSMDIRRTSTSGFTPQHAIALEAATNEVSSILANIPTDVALHELSADQYRQILEYNPTTRSSYGAQLWTLLDGVLGGRRVAKSKLFARKRPHLIPIRDSVVAGALGDPMQWWQPWWETLTTRNDIVDRLECIRAEAEAPDLSLLRVADIVIWNRFNPRRPSTNAG